MHWPATGYTAGAAAGYPGYQQQVPSYQQQQQHHQTVQPPLQHYYHQQQHVTSNPPLLPTPPQYHHHQYYPASAANASAASSYHQAAPAWNAAAAALQQQHQQHQVIQQQYLNSLTAPQHFIQPPAHHQQQQQQQQLLPEVTSTADYQQYVRRGRGGRGRDVAATSASAPYWRPHGGRTQEEDLRLSILRFENDLLWSVFVTAASGHADATPSSKPKGSFKRPTYRPTTITAVSPAAPDSYKPPTDPNSSSSSNSSANANEVNNTEADPVHSVSPSTCSSDYY